MTHRAFPIVYSTDVHRSVEFYGSLGFEPYYHFPDEQKPDYVGLRRNGSDIGIVTTQSPKALIGVDTGTSPRFELFTYVDSVDEEVERLRASGVRVLREPEDMPWGDRLGYVADPDGNPVVLAASAQAS
jgi:lactoylglutathione lyase